VRSQNSRTSCRTPGVCSRNVALDPAVTPHTASRISTKLNRSRTGGQDSAADRVKLGMHPRYTRGPTARGTDPVRCIGVRVSCALTASFLLETDAARPSPCCRASPVGVLTRRLPHPSLPGRSADSAPSTRPARWRRAHGQTRTIPCSLRSDGEGGAQPCHLRPIRHGYHAALSTVALPAAHPHAHARKDSSPAKATRLCAPTPGHYRQIEPARALRRV